MTQREEKAREAIHEIDREFRKRVDDLCDAAGAYTLWDVPQDKRAALFQWRTERYREAWGRDPHSGELTPAARRELRTQEGD